MNALRDWLPKGLEKEYQLIVRACQRKGLQWKARTTTGGATDDDRRGDRRESSGGRRESPQGGGLAD
ncbi:MAG: hypothetical protein LBF62_11820 [Tannerellaceae bacterium]|jgi:hypothetical protein|nr:hypothetical protein [Tannerellaceae bacterium]